jgi:hypothetical protein
MGDFIQELKRLGGSLEKLGGKHEVRLEDLFPPLFMIENTAYGSIEEFLRASPVTIQNQADFDRLTGPKLDPFVRAKTRFQSWEEMQGTAAEEWMKRKFEEELS